MKKKVLFGFIGCLLVSILAIGGTIAWLTDNEEAVNKVTIGHVDIEVNETWENGVDGQNVAPGVEVAKDPTVKNIGKNPAYIRVRVEISNTFYEPFLEINYQVEPNGNWFKEGEYYYYKAIVDVNNSTTPVFTKFMLNDNFIEPPVTAPSDTEQPGFDIVVYAEAIQSEAFEPEYSENDTVAEKEAKFKAAIIGAFANY